MVLVAEALEESELGASAAASSATQKLTCTDESLLSVANRDQRAARALRSVPAAIDAGRGEEAPSGVRRERHADQQLGIVADAGALGRVGPSVVEHELAHAVALEVERAGGDDLFLRPWRTTR